VEKCVIAINTTAVPPQFHPLLSVAPSGRSDRNLRRVNPPVPSALMLAPSALATTTDVRAAMLRTFGLETAAAVVAVVATAAAAAAAAAAFF
jgi:hypothetical protein